MEEEGIALMGRLYKMMMIMIINKYDTISVHRMGRLDMYNQMMNINKYDGNISTYDVQVVQDDDYEYQQI